MPRAEDLIPSNIANTAETLLGIEDTRKVSNSQPNLQHNNANTAHLLLIRQIPIVDPSWDRRSAIVV